MFFPLFAWCNVVHLSGISPWSVWASTTQKMNFHPDVRQAKIGECVKTHYFCGQHPLSERTVCLETRKSSNFDTFFKTDVFSCAFLHPAFFHIFASTLRSELCFDCKVEAPRNFRLYRFSLNENPEVSLYRSAYGC